MVLLLSILLTTAIACGGGEAEPTPTPTEIPTPTAVPTLPNLKITSIAFDSATGCEGDTVVFTITIENQGTLSSPSCHWWLTIYEAKESLGTLIGLPPGASTVVNTSITLDSNITGTFNTTAIVDSMSEVAELNESDNQFIQPLTVSMCNFPSNYDSDKSKIQTALNTYRASHNGSIPVTNHSVTLSDPSGTYPIIDICLLLGAGNLLNEVPASCVDSSFDNCEANTCACKQNAHYVWLVDGTGTVLSSCRGGDCETNFADGYQGIWP